MVLVKFRTMKSKLYKIDLPSNANISQAKEEISKEMGGSDPKCMKMMYKAKVLSNDVPISSLHLGEKDFIIVNTPQQKEAKPITDEKPKPVEPISNEKPPEPEPIPLFRTPESESAENNEQKFIDGVKQLTEIGFDQELATQALKLSNGNVDIAAELIITGQIGGNSQSSENSEDEAEQPTQNVQQNDQQNDQQNTQNLQQPVMNNNVQLPPGLTNLPQDQAAETLLAALPQKDQDAIHRLQQLGNFNLLEVIQVYHACDKNEELAASILFSNYD